MFEALTPLPYLRSLKPQNPNVPLEIKNWEMQREEIHILQGKVRQLRNDVYRQRRFRVLNERSCNHGKERRDRFEHLVSEMKDDLISLKERLNEELDELGKILKQQIKCLCVIGFSRSYS